MNKKSINVLYGITIFIFHIMVIPNTQAMEKQLEIFERLWRIPSTHTMYSKHTQKHCRSIKKGEWRVIMYFFKKYSVLFMSFFASFIWFLMKYKNIFWYFGKLQNDQHVPLDQSNDVIHDTFIQMKVAKQQGSLCGYHALLNALYIVHRCYDPTVDIKRKLNDKKAKDALFSRGGQWVEWVIEQRRYNKIKNALKSVLKASIRTDQLRSLSDQERSMYYRDFIENTFLNQIATHITQSMVWSQSDSDDDDFVTCELKKGYLQKQSSHEKFKDIQLYDIVTHYINFETLKNNIKGFKGDKRNKFSEIAYGWLDETELKMLIDKIGKWYNVSMQDHHYLIVPNIDEYRNQRFFDESGLEETIKRLINAVDQGQVKAIPILLGSMRQINDKKGERGHWRSLVYTLDREGKKPCWYGADSLYETATFENDPDVTYLRDLFNGIRSKNKYPRSTAGIGKISR